MKMEMVLTKQAYLNEKIISGKEGLELLQAKDWLIMLLCLISFTKENCLMI